MRRCSLVFVFMYLTEEASRFNISPNVDDTYILPGDRYQAN